MDKNLVRRIAVIIVAGVSLLVASLESITYFGYIGNHFFVPSIMIYVLSLGLTIAFRQYLPSDSKLKKIIQYATIASITSLVILSFIEALTFPNFIFAKTHLNLLSYPYLVFLIMSLFSIYNSRQEKISFIVSNIFLYLGLSLYIFLNVPKVITGIYKGIGEIVSAPFATYDQKMKLSYGDFYVAMRHVQDLTPKDAIIGIPPQENPWLTEGNGALVQYFIYPRQLTQLNGIDGKLTPTYYLIAKGSWHSDDSNKYGWPKEPIKASRIWEFKNDGTAVEYERDYDPNADKWDWGLIEVAK